MAYNKMTFTTLVVTLLSLLFAKNVNAANQTANFLEMRNNNITSWNSTMNFDLKRSNARHLISGGTGFHYCYKPHYHNHKKFPTTIDNLQIDKLNGKLNKIWRGTEMGFNFQITPSEDIIEGTQLWPSFLVWVLDPSESKQEPIIGDPIDICSLIDCPAPAGQQISFTAKVKIPQELLKTNRCGTYGRHVRFEFAVPTQDSISGDAAPYEVLTCAQHSVKVDDMRDPGLGGRGKGCLKPGN